MAMMGEAEMARMAANHEPALADAGADRSAEASHITLLVRTCSRDTDILRW